MLIAACLLAIGVFGYIWLRSIAERQERSMARRRRRWIEAAKKWQALDEADE